ncbi:MAG: hypothetical protein ABI400_11105 [Lacisediminihabitans sp.]
MNKKLMGSLTLTFVLISLIFVATPAQACTREQDLTVGCPQTEATAQINGDGVDLSASKDLPGNGKGKSNGNGNGNGTGSGQSTTGGSSGTKATTPRPPDVPGPGDPYYRDPYTVIAPVTISDLVNFKPAPGVDHMEPNGWMIVGLNTNFYATAQSQVQTGVLLGQQASVRFTPARFRWSYGDGHSANLGTKGATWAAQGIREFERTPTSHVYAKAGSYDIDLTIDFSAEYRYAGDNWIPVVGTLPVPANRLHATAGDAKTVLVQRNCSALPRGPGC